MNCSQIHRNQTTLSWMFILTGRQPERQEAKMTQVNICPNMSVRFRLSRAAHYWEKKMQLSTDKRTHSHSSHNNNTINSTMCSLSAALMSWGQSIKKPMGMRLVAPVTPLESSHSESCQNWCLCIVDAAAFRQIIKEWDDEVCHSCDVTSVNTVQLRGRKASDVNPIQVCMSQVEAGGY